METLELVLHQAVNLGIVLFELMGVIVIAVSGIKGVINYIRHNPQIRLQLAQGMALSLEFKLGSEILRTVIVREISEIATVACIICLRAALTFLIHWEIKAEEQGENAKIEGANAVHAESVHMGTGSTAFDTAEERHSSAQVSTEHHATV